MALQNTTTRANLENFISEAWLDRSNNYFRENCPLAQFFMNETDNIRREGGGKYHRLHFQKMTANKRASGADVNPNNTAQSEVVLTIDTHAECSFIIDDTDAAALFNRYDTWDTLVKNAAYEAGFELEKDIATALGSINAKTGSTTGVQTSSASVALGDVELLSAQTNLGEAMQRTFDMNDGITWIMSRRVFYNEVQSVNKFSINYTTPVQDPVAKRPTAAVYGFPMLLTDVIKPATGRNKSYLAHRSAIAWGARDLGIHSTSSGYTAGMIGGATMGRSGKMGVRIQANYIPEQFGVLVTTDINYGVVVNRVDASVQILSKTV